MGRTQVVVAALGVTGSVLGSAFDVVETRTRRPARKVILTMLKGG
jgi:hypothetical protein